MIEKLIYYSKLLLYVVSRFPQLLYVPDQGLLGMTTRWEQAYLRWYAKNRYSGQGEIVDLGCWLGSATISLAKGLEANRRVRVKEKRIHAYDIFVWESWMDKIAANTPLEGRYKAWENFLDEYERRVIPWKNLIQVHAGDLNKIGWDRKRQIEFLFNDASKSWKLTNSIIQNFYPSLVPGVSLYIEQDFAHYYTSWIHLIRYRLRDYFKPLFHIPFSGSVAFKYIKAIPDELLKVSYSFSAFSTDEIESAFEYSLGLVLRDMQGEILGAKVMLFVHSGDMDRARYEFKKVEDMGMHLTLVKPYLATKT